MVTVKKASLPQDAPPPFPRRAAAPAMPGAAAASRGTGPRATVSEAVFFYRRFARDRPSRYGVGSGFLLSGLCEGQALALRGRGSVPRAPGQETSTSP